MMTTEAYVECGCCGQFHREAYWGDCRNDKERFFEDQLPKDSTITYLPEEENKTVNVNAIQAIMPYRQFGTWVFDDPNAGLVREPFVLGIPEMIDVMVADISNAKDGFRLNFSITKPAKTDGVHHIKLMALEKGGAWYRDTETRMCGWLCPATLLYFQIFPEEMYIWGDGMVASAQVATHNMNKKLIDEMQLEPSSVLIMGEDVIANGEDWQDYLDRHGIAKDV